MPRQPQAGKVPRYQQIADDLRKRINQGDFAESGRLPAEKELLTRYSPAALGTVRQALAVLRDEGLIESRRGAGVYVRAYRPIVRNALKRLSAEQWGSGHSMWELDVDDRDLQVVDVQIEQLPADAQVARALMVEEGVPVWRRSRLYLVDGVPVMRAVSHVPHDLAEGTRITQVDTGPGGIYARLADTGHGPARFREEVRCRMPLATEARDLELSQATPVVEVHRHAYDEAGRVVEVNRMILDSSRYLLVYDFPS